MKRVLIIEPEMMSYRVPFYAKLHAALHDREIALRVAYSERPAADLSRQLTPDLPPEYGVKVRAVRGPGQRIIFQPLFREAVRADLVVVDQANRFIQNHLLIAASLMGLKRVAYWGHGRSRQANRFSEWYKRRILNCVDWWFAYTHGTREYLVASGVNRAKITTVGNSIDTEELRANLSSISEQELDRERARLGIDLNSLVGIFCGSLYGLKSVPLLLEAAKLIKSRIARFHLILIGGGGPRNDAGQYLPSPPDWIHCTGPRFGREKACLLRLANVFLLPGAVGLAILDAFVAGLPLVTTDIPCHGPEIEYLEAGKNGLIVGSSVRVYADAVLDLLSDPQRLKSMSVAAKETSKRYSIDYMVDNFCDGIKRCLQEKVVATDVAEAPIDNQLG